MTAPDPRFHGRTQRPAKTWCQRHWVAVLWTLIIVCCAVNAVAVVYFTIRHAAPYVFRTLYEMLVLVSP